MNLSALADIAEHYAGIEESPRGSNCGKVVDWFKAATTLNPHEDWPWCAAFVSRMVQEFDRLNPNTLGCMPPRCASAYGFEDWGEAHRCEVFSNPATARRGDIVTFRISHIGIVSGIDGTHVRTIEGNTNDDGSREGYEVARRTRDFSFCRRFIRMPLK